MIRGFGEDKEQRGRKYNSEDLKISILWSIAFENCIGREQFDIDFEIIFNSNRGLQTFLPVLLGYQRLKPFQKQYDFVFEKRIYKHTPFSRGMSPGIVISCKRNSL